MQLRQRLRDLGAAPGHEGRVLRDWLHSEQADEAGSARSLVALARSRRTVKKVVFMGMGAALASARHSHQVTPFRRAACGGWLWVVAGAGWGEYLNQSGINFFCILRGSFCAYRYFFRKAMILCSYSAPAYL